MLAMVLTWLLTLFFAIAAVLNFIEPPQIRAQFKKWGFPGWFHCAVMVGVIVSIKCSANRRIWFLNSGTAVASQYPPHKTDPDWLGYEHQ
jgi:hypothetical protein